MKKTLLVALLGAALSCGAYAETYKVGVVDTVAYNLDVDFFAALSQKTGDQYELVKIRLDEMKEKLLEGDVDFVSHARRADFHGKIGIVFSMPYSSAEPTLLLDKSKVKNVKGLKNKLVCASSLVTQAKAKKLGAKVLSFEDPNEKYNALQDGKCDALISFKPTNDSFLEENPDNAARFAEARPWLNIRENFTIAGYRTHRPVIHNINKAIRAMRRDGTLDKVFDRHTAK